MAAVSTQDHGLLEFDLRLIEGVVDEPLRVTPTVEIPAAELTWRFSRSSGAGGQHVNTTDSRVELTWDLDGSSALDETQRARALHRLAGALVDGTAHGHRVGATLAAAQP